MPLGDCGIILHGYVALILTLALYYHAELDSEFTRKESPISWLVQLHITAFDERHHLTGG